MAKKNDNSWEVDYEDYTRYEKARMIGSRALQLSMGAPFLVKLSEKDLESINYDIIEIALKEFDAQVLPITVRRPIAGKVAN
tara:strand:+ start:212 stop:457 length:246 start_codon:yes stop_codon:yes gene_type:complete